MTEKTAQEIIDLLTLNGRKPEHIKKGERVVYLSDAISIVRKALMTDHQTTFAVGEYYADDVFIYKIRRVNPNSLKVDYLNKQTGDFVADEHWSLWIPTPKPATAEQIAMFKLAEIKSDIGLIIKNGNADWIEIVEDIEEYLAEELQEVGDE
ncbi:hypothetical protein [Enterococcus rotai]|uniref:hypothetical protein n=1 Tax=Enterococcus rotai TaxID=118060 RepID=UPI0035C666B3